MEIWKIGLAAVAGYLLGSISVAIVACRRLYGAMCANMEAATRAQPM